MSQILNSLDGIDDLNSNIVRIFTGNNSQIIFETPALINRMSAIFNFKKPTREMFQERFNQILPHFISDKNTSIIFDTAVDKTLTMRPFTNFIVRYMWNDSPIQKMIENLKIGIWR